MNSDFSSSLISVDRPLPVVPQHFFVASDIVWAKVEGYPYWPGEVLSADANNSFLSIRFFSPPFSKDENSVIYFPHSLRITKKLPLESEAGNSKMDGESLSDTSVSVPSIDHLVPWRMLYFFDFYSTHEALTNAIEERLKRKCHDVESYEKQFCEGVYYANSLVRIPLHPDCIPSIEVQPIGVVYSFMRTPQSAPRQPNTKEFLPQAAVIRLRKGLENGLRNLKGFEWIWVLFYFNHTRGLRAPRKGDAHARGFKTMVVPPRGEGIQKGVFSTRSPHRPNFIGLSCCRLLFVEKLHVYIADHDLLHGTPIIDIKPYIPYCDSHPSAKAGWIDDIEQRNHRIDNPEASGEDVRQVLSDHRKNGRKFSVHRNEQSSNDTQSVKRKKIIGSF